MSLSKSTFGDQGQFSTNGQRTNANWFAVDGASANIGVSAGLTLVQSASGSLPGLGATGGTNTLVSVEAIEEFHVQTSAYSAEYGRVPGAQVTILTRSGTNRLHGVLFDYFRNNALDANDWFANAQQLPPPALRQNDFGGVLSGPVRRDRTFFFFSYEGLRLRQPQVLATDVPSMAARNPRCAACKPFLVAFPVPNRPGDVLGFSPFVASYSDAAALDATSLRVDHALGSRATLFGRYNHAPSNYIARPNMLSNPITTNVGTDTLTLGSTVLLSPRLTADTRVNYSRTSGESYARLDTFGGAQPFDPALFFPKNVNVDDAFGVLSLSGGIHSSFYIGKNVANSQQQWNVVESVAYTRGLHQLKFGADWRRVSTLNNPRAYDLEAYFAGALGAAYGLTMQTVVGAQQRITVYFENLSLYAQDAWKILPRLTLTLGVRWERNPPPYGSLPLYTFTGYEVPKSIQVAPAGTPLYDTANGNFAPRAAFSYQVRPSTTLRAGYGMFYDLGAGLMAQSSAAFPYFRQVNLNLGRGTVFPVPDDLAQPLPFTLSPPITSIYGAQQGLRLPLTHEWNVTLEQALGASRMVSLAYAGAAGRHLLRETYYLNPTREIVYAYLLTNQACSDFHSLQAQFRQTLARGFTTLAAYTFGKSLDNVSTESALNLNAAELNPRADRGPSDFDIRQTVTAGFSWTLFRDWGLDGVLLARTATPVDVTYTRDVGFGLAVLRPDTVPGVATELYDPNVAGGRMLNFEAFSLPDTYPGRQGTLGRNAFRGFPLAQLNLTVRRDIRLRENWKLQARAEMFNVTNHPTFADPSGALFSSEFGVSTQMLGRGLGRGGVNGGLNPLYQVGGPRSIQLALRMVF